MPVHWFWGLWYDMIWYALYQCVLCYIDTNDFWHFLWVSAAPLRSPEESLQSEPLTTEELAGHGRWGTSGGFWRRRNHGFSWRGCTGKMHSIYIYMYTISIIYTTYIYTHHVFCFFKISIKCHSRQYLQWRNCTAGIYIYTHTYKYTYIYVFTHIYIHTYIYTYLYIYIYIHIYMYMYTCVYIYNFQIRTRCVASQAARSTSFQIHSAGDATSSSPRYLVLVTLAEAPSEVTWFLTYHLEVYGCVWK